MDFGLGLLWGIALGVLLTAFLISKGKDPPRGRAA